MMAPRIVGQALRLPNAATAGDAPALRTRLNNRQPKENDAGDAIGRAFARACLWRTPPHWSSSDWRAEVRAILCSAAAFAGLTYDPRRRVPLRAHIYMRASAAAWTRYRQEWAYYLHFAVESAIMVEPVVASSDQGSDREAIDRFLSPALRQLSVEDQWLIRQLFWHGAGQSHIATILDVSQQEISRRKARVLRQLRRRLNGQASLLFCRLATLGWALFDSLDLLPAIDFL